YLLQALFACRIRIHSITKVSPFKLVYGLDPIIPGDTTHPHLFDFVNEEDYSAYRQQQFDQINEIRRKAHGLQQDAADHMASCYDSQNDIDQDKFQPGDAVLVKHFAKKKFDQSFYGPLRIIRATPLHTFQLAWPDGTIKADLVHQDRLKKAVLVDNEMPSSPWYKPKSAIDESTMDNSMDGLPIEPDPLTARLQDFAKQRHDQEQFIADRDANGPPSPIIPPINAAEINQREYRRLSSKRSRSSAIPGGGVS
ncbi:hypothetical protein BX616_008755, partial [Lobosporangium transversale]